jgi:hypothetical protein
MKGECSSGLDTLTCSMALLSVQGIGDGDFINMVCNRSSRKASTYADKTMNCSSSSTYSTAPLTGRRLGKRIKPFCRHRSLES